MDLLIDAFSDMNMFVKLICMHGILGPLIYLADWIDNMVLKVTTYIIAMTPGVCLVLYSIVWVWYWIFAGWLVVEYATTFVDVVLYTALTVGAFLYVLLGVLTKFK